MRLLIYCLCILSVLSACASTKSGTVAIVEGIRPEPAPVLVTEPSGSVYEKAVSDLAGQVKSKGIAKLKVGFGKLSFQDTDLSSNFVPFLTSQLSLGLAKYPVFQELSRDSMKNILKEQELSMIGLTEGSNVESTQLKGIDAFISGTYMEEGLNVRVNLYLVKVVSAEKIAVTSVLISKNEIPQGIELKPANFNTMLSSMKALTEDKGTAKDFKVSVWTDKGESPIYEEGDAMKIFFKSNKDCYVRLYYLSADNQINMIFPNQYDKNDFIKANIVYAIPGDASSFDFTISPPFGAEMVKAVASLQPFPDKEFRDPGTEVFKSFGDASPDTVKKIMTRGIKIVPVNARTEDTVTLTTTPK